MGTFSEGNCLGFLTGSQLREISANPIVGEQPPLECSSWGTRILCASVHGMMPCTTPGAPEGPQCRHRRGTPSLDVSPPYFSVFFVPRSVWCAPCCTDGAAHHAFGPLQTCIHTTTGS